MSQKVMVTGGAGFIGSHLVRDLVRLGYRVRVLDNFRRGNFLDSGLCSSANLELVQGDIRNTEDVRAAMARADLVVHLAAQSNVMGSLQDSNYCYQTNVLGTHNVLTEARSAAVRRVIFASSREVYGDPTSLPVPESAALNPKNLYGASKVAGEMICRFASEADTEVSIVRLANVYGPNDKDRVIPLFLSRAIKGLPLTIYGGCQVLDLVHVDDVILALTRLLEGVTVPREPINIGTGVGTTVADLAKSISGLMDRDVPIQVLQPREVEVKGFVASVDRMTTILGVHPRTDLVNQLREMLPHYS